MDLGSLHLLIEVAEARSFSEVARRRDVDVSSVSRTIAALEAELGVRLFQRTTRKMVLTDAGSEYLSRIIPLLDELESANDAARIGALDPSGTVRITASVAFGQIKILPLLCDFRELFPNVSLDLLLTDANLDLIAERIDIAVRLGPTYRGDVIGTKLFPTAYRVVASPSYIARFGHPAAPTDLSRHACLLFPIPGFRTRWLFRRNDRKVEQVPISGHLTLSTALALVEAAVNGLGPVLIGDWAIQQELRDGRLVDLFPDHEVTATVFDTAAWLLYPSREHLPHRVRITIDYLRTRLGQS